MRRVGQAVATFYRRAYEDNLTGLAGMVAYNLLLSVFPLALLALFVTGRVLESAELERRVLEDLRDLFPSAAESTLRDALDRLRRSSTGIGIFALVVSVWFGASFWGALDTAFCRIYHMECRTWVQQKRFALAMLVVVLLFMVATVAVPAVQGFLAAETRDLPFGLANVEGLVFVVTLVAGLLLIFGILCVVYVAVPNCLVPWRAVWPGALGATLAIGVVDYAFPFYLTNFSTVGQFGTTLVFILIVLLWFYALAIIMLGGATINSMRLRPEPAAGEAV